MTPEERFSKIENALHALTETQAKHESAIRDLITVSRTFLDSQREMSGHILGLRDAQMRTDAEIRDLGEAQRHTDERLNALIDTVDRIIRNRNGDRH